MSVSVGEKWVFTQAERSGIYLDQWGAQATKGNQAMGQRDSEGLGRCVGGSMAKDFDRWLSERLGHIAVEVYARQTWTDGIREMIVSAVETARANGVAEGMKTAMEMLAPETLPEPEAKSKEN
jgi:hypothetical protein